jgi:hypothetical protein
MVFFNNRGNPYGDVNFIEARDQLRANYWRQFAGLAAVIQGFVSATRPEARLNLLYYIPPLRREYMNRILALGWIPSLEYCGVVASRPFFQAAYEVGNCTPVPARYTPDWKRDKETTLESYAVRRRGDAGVLLSFIHHAEARETVPVRIELDGLDLDRTGQVFIWECQVEDGLDYEGLATEDLVRKTYAETGWQLDRVTRRRLLYSGPYRPELELPLDLEPLILHQLYVTPSVAAVYSEDRHPANYLFASMPQVYLRPTCDWQRGALEVQIDSRRQEAELLLALPLAQYRVTDVRLDGQPATPDWVAEGPGVFPLIRVGPGEQTLVLRFAPAPVRAEITPPAFTLTPAATEVTVSLPGLERALLTVEQQGRVLFNRLVSGHAGALRLPLAPIRAGGTYTVAARAVPDADGGLRPVSGAAVSVELPAASVDLGVGPEYGERAPDEQRTTPVNRAVQGVEVLNAATLTTGETANDIQPGLKLQTASANPDALTIEAGTSRAVLQGQDGLLGAAFAGLELKDLRRVKLLLTNTFHNAFHLRGPGFHVPERPNSRNFAGIVVDYHTPAGYTHRVALAAGVRHRECNSPYPDWGRAAVADVSRDLGSALVEVPAQTFALDLRAWAPPEWDGQVWLSVGTDWVCANRRLGLQVLAVNEAATGEVLAGTDPRAFREAYERPRALGIPRSPGGIVIDGLLSEESWREAGRTEDFFLLGGEGVSKARTTALLMYDQANLYVAFLCQETERRKPLIIGGPPWDDDEVEVWLDADNDRKTFRQVILNAANGRMEYWESGPGPIGATTAVHVEEGDSWTVEMAIPFAGLGVKAPQPGDSWRLSLCRGRPPGKTIPTHELLVWAPLRNGFNDLENFGSATFR